MLELQNISVQFGGIKALNNVSFKIEKQSLFSIIGPNGAGKTSLLNVISGRYKANNGKLFYNNSLDQFKSEMTKPTFEEEFIYRVGEE